MDGATNQELMTELLERLKGIRLEDIQARVDEALNDPAVAERLKGAEGKLDRLREDLPEIMMNRINVITETVAEKIKDEYPETADKVKNFELAPEDYEKMQENVASMTKDFGQWYDRCLKETVDEAVSGFTQRVKDQFNERADHAAQETALKRTQADVNMADTLYQMYKNVGRDSVGAMMPMLKSEGNSGQNIINILNEKLIADGEKPFEVKDSPEAAVGGMTP